VIVALGAVLGMLGGLLSASPALAAGRGPNWEFLSPQDSSVPADFCGFEVLISPTASKQFAKELKVTDGSVTILITGTLKVSFTNPSNLKTISENVSSSSTLTFNANGSMTVVNRGRAPLLLSTADAQRLGLPRVSVVAGRLTISTDSNETPVFLNGHAVVDVCAALS
jgi:hypothetical protein